MNLNHESSLIFGAVVALSNSFEHEDLDDIEEEEDGGAFKFLVEIVAALGVSTTVLCLRQRKKFLDPSTISFSVRSRPVYTRLGV